MKKYSYVLAEIITRIDYTSFSTDHELSDEEINDIQSGDISVYDLDEYAEVVETETLWDTYECSVEKE
jgi:hypothetical protein